jgi:hypothetical protein
MSGVEEQLNYEYLLRHLYGRERRDLIGVSADAWTWYQASKYHPSEEFDYKTETKKIKKNIFDAIDYKLNQYLSEDNQVNIDKLLEYRAKLEKVNEYDDIRDLVKEMHAIYW